LRKIRGTNRKGVIRSNNPKKKSDGGIRGKKNDKIGPDVGHTR